MVAVLTLKWLVLTVDSLHMFLQAFAVGKCPFAHLARFVGEPGLTARALVLSMDDLVVLHLAQLLEALAAHIAGVGAIVTVNFTVDTQFVKSVCLVFTNVTLGEKKMARKHLKLEYAII